MSIYSVGISGLNAAQTGILTTSHNISNASTPGFSRQQIFQTTNTPMLTGAGFLGQGASVETIRRVYSEQLNDRVLSAQTGAAEMDSYLSQISQVSNLLADPDAGLSPALSAFFKAVQEMAANPASIPARQAMLSGSEALVGRIQAIDQRLTEIRGGINSMVTSEVAAINSYSQQLAEINQRIIYAQAVNPNQPPNDLYDQRDQLIAGLNEKVRVSTLEQNDGTFSVFIGNGQPLVVGTLNYSMQALAASDDPERTVIAIRSPTGSVVTMPESMISGGALGGLIAFRRDSLDVAQNSLGRIALTLATNFNEQHRLGQDLTGALGGNFFDLSNAGPTIRANANNADLTDLPVVTLTNVGSLGTSDFRLSYDGTNYSLTRIADGTSWSNAALGGLPWPIDGITVTAGTWTPPTAGDSFLIQPTRAGAMNLAMAVSDPRAIAAAAPIRTAAALANTGTGAVSAGTVNAPPPPNVNLQQPVTITFTSATTFNVTGTGTGNPVGVAYTAGGDITYNGWTIQVSGNPVAGDVFTVGPNSNGVADNRNGVLLGGLQTKSTMEGGTATYQSAYSGLVAQVGNKARQVEITGQAQRTLYEQAQSSRDQLSGVNLDEEAANLLRYQQAYQAAARLINIASSLFDEILALGR